MTHSNTDFALIFFGSLGTHLFDHPAAEVAGFPGSQVTIVAVGQVDTDLLSLISILKRSIASRPGDIDLVVVLAAHFGYLLFVFAHF